MAGPASFAGPLIADPARDARWSVREVGGGGKLSVAIDVMPRLNYALYFAGLPFLQAIVLRNDGEQTLSDLIVRVWLAPKYGEEWMRSISELHPGDEVEVDRILIPLDVKRLQAVREAERGSLRVQVEVGGRTVFSETRDVLVLAYNEWYYHPYHPETTASFIQPNTDATKQVVRAVRDGMRTSGSDASLDGYQSGDREKVAEVARVLFRVLQSELRISYAMPPASFERSESFPGGLYTVSQKVRFPREVLDTSMGTCLDLALLCAGCMEAMGFHPLFFLVPGHAFWGVWTGQHMLDRPVITDVGAVLELIEQGQWLPYDSVTFTRAAGDLETCQRDALRYLKRPPSDLRFFCVVDVAAARAVGVRPIPPLPMRSGAEG